MSSIVTADALLLKAHLRVGLPIHGYSFGNVREVPAVRIATSDAVGFGEAPPLPSFTGYTSNDTLTLLQSVLPALHGQEPEGALHWLHCTDGIPDPQARAAIDIALHDLIATRQGVPVYHLLGGEEPKKVRISRAIGLHSPERAVDLALDYQRQEITALKLKLGRGLEADVETLLRVREAVGSETEIGIDANEAYTLEEAWCLWTNASDATPAYFEQPVARADLVGMKELRLRGVPVIADESAFDVASVRNLGIAGAADGVAIKLIKCGGLRPAVEMAAEALVHGLHIIVIDPLGSAISLNAGLHLATVLPVPPYAHGLSASYEVDAPYAPHKPAAKGHLLPTPQPGLGAQVMWSTHSSRP